MLEARDLACQRGDALLFRDLNFVVTAGEALVVRGTNGSGKTSLLRILAGLASPHAGQLLWEGNPVRPLASVMRAQLAYLGHTAPLKDELTVTENLAFALRLDGIRASAAALQEALTAVGLGSRRDLAARLLSQGQRRRIGLARLALAARRLWLLDEPLTALDSAGSALFNSRLLSHLEQGGTAVLTTHQDLGLPARSRELVLQ